MIDFPINTNPYYFKMIDSAALAEAYLRNIYRMVHHRHFSYLGIFTGEHRVGKSLGAVSFSYLLDKTFEDNFEDRVVYYPNEFMDAICKIAEQKIKGGAIVWDEAQIKHGSRDWYTSVNKAINTAIQSFGYLNPIVFYVTQDPSFIDSQPRKLFRSFYEVKRTNNKYSTILPFNIEYNRRTGKPYYVYPRFYDWHSGTIGTKLKMHVIKLMKQPKELNKRYEKHSEVFKDKLLKRTRDMTRSLLQKELEQTGKREYDEEAILKSLMDEKENPIFLTRDGRFRPEMIASEFSVPHSYARVLKIKADQRLKELG